MNRQPFTIFEATVYLYLVDAQDQATDEVYMGGCAESVSLDQSFISRKLEYHGARYGREFHEDENHVIEIKNLWLHDRAEVLPKMPVTKTRNVRYALVVIWEDMEEGVWNKRTYLGVTSEGQRVEQPAQTLKFRAEAMIEVAGNFEDGLPSIEPAVPGLVRYVDEAGTLDLYTYDSDSHQLVVIDPSRLTGRADITIGDDSLEVKFDGVRSLYATPTETQMANLQALGGTFLDELPRLEFYLGVSRLASLGARGTLVTANVAETNAPQVVDFELRSALNHWLFSFALPKSLFPSLTEVA